MKRALLALLSALFVAAFLLSCATPSREQGLVGRAAEAMGGAEKLASIKTLTARVSVKQWEPEQSDVPGGEPRFANEATIEVTQDRDRRAVRNDVVKNFAYPAPRTFTYSEIVTPDAGFVLGVDSNGRNAQNQKMNPPAHSMSGYRLATTQREGRRGNISALVLAMRAAPERVQPAADIDGQPAVAFDGFIVAFDPASYLPSRVRSLDYDNIWGDVTYEVVFSDWRDFSGIKIPVGRKTLLNGRMLSESTISELRVNPPVDAKRFEVPAELTAGAAKPATDKVPYQWVIRRQFIGTYLDSDNVSYDTRGSQPGLRLQEVAPGVFQTQGGSHNSLVVVMSDHLVVLDAPVTDAQSVWLVRETKARFAGKPIRWLALTHHHMDHAGGMRAILAEGGTLVVGQGGGAHYRRVLSAPMTRNPDMTPREFTSTPILEVPESHMMTDSAGRSVIVYLMDNPHAKGMLMGWVPHAKLGFVTDIWTPGPPLPAKPNPGLASVVNTVKRAGVTPERFAGGHGSTADYQSLVKLVGQ